MIYSCLPSMFKFDQKYSGFARNCLSLFIDIRVENPETFTFNGSFLEQQNVYFFNNGSFDVCRLDGPMAYSDLIWNEMCAKNMDFEDEILEYCLFAHIIKNSPYYYQYRLDDNILRVLAAFERPRLIMHPNLFKKIVEKYGFDMDEINQKVYYPNSFQLCNSVGEKLFFCGDLYNEERLTYPLKQYEMRTTGYYGGCFRKDTEINENSRSVSFYLTDRIRQDVIVRYFYKAGYLIVKSENGEEFLNHDNRMVSGSKFAMVVNPLSFTFIRIFE